MPPPAVNQPIQVNNFLRLSFDMDEDLEEINNPLQTPTKEEDPRELMESAHITARFKDFDSIP